jgi:hypothetical protein
VGEEIDERAGGRFYGIAVGIDSVRLDGSQVPGGKNADLAIEWRYRDPTRRITLDEPLQSTRQPLRLGSEGWIKAHNTGRGTIRSISARNAARLLSGRSAQTHLRRRQMPHVSPNPYATIHPAADYITVSGH